MDSLLIIILAVIFGLSAWVWWRQRSAAAKAEADHWAGQQQEWEQRMAGSVGRATTSVSRQPAEEERPARPAYDWDDLDEYEVEVVGESFYRNAFRQLLGPASPEGCDARFEAELIPDAANAQDVNAVKVVIRGLKVGHLNRQDAATYRNIYGTERLTVPAAVTGWWDRGGGDSGDAGVRLNLNL